MENAFWGNIFKGWRKEENPTVLTLKQVPIFEGFSNKQYREIENLIHERTYKPNEYVFKKKAPGVGMYIILSGKVEIFIEEIDGKKQTLAELKEGDFFGELSLLDEEVRSASAKAKDHSTLLGFFRPDLFSLLERNPELGNKILLNLARVIGARLRKTNELLSESPEAK